ncbi:phage holin family protein [Anaerovoracaceae bacterium 41-7]|uniref:phage holin family protein n=1 Tax=Emergencia sp. JLR.KK010 TaxID=3114296 RepID=UPI0030D0D6B3
MERLFNNISIVTGFLGGFVCSWLGGWDVILRALVFLVVLDYATGVLKALYMRTLSSAVGFKGLLRKIMIFIVVATAVIIQGVVGNSIPLREIVIIFFICNEGISLLENASEFVPIPERLKATLIQLREKEDNHV